VNAADEQDIRSRFAGRSQKVGHRCVRKRTGRRVAFWSDEVKSRASSEIAFESVHERLQLRFMYFDLIPLLA
jgi:hypothetical protein